MDSRTTPNHAARSHNMLASGEDRSPEDSLFGGIIWNKQAAQFNGCFIFDGEKQAFLLSRSQVRSSSAHAHMRAALNNREFFDGHAKAVVRLVFYTSEAAGARTRPTSVATGLFISPTVMVTRALQMETQDEVNNAKIITHKVTFDALAFGMSHHV